MILVVFTLLAKFATVFLLLSMPKVSRRSCALLSCSNSWYQIEKWMGQICGIHNCNFGTASCICEPPFKLLPFPTENADPIGRQKWTSAVNRKVGTKNWCPTRESRICSIHFVDKKPSPEHPYPTLELGYIPCGTCSTKPVRPPPRQRILTPPAVKKHKSIPETCRSETDHDYSKFCEQSNIREKQLDKENQMLKGKILKLENEVVYYKTLYCRKSQRKKTTYQQLSINNVLLNDKKCKFYTGIPSVAAFNTIFEIIQEKTDNIKYWKGPQRNCNPLKHKYFNPKCRKLTKKQELILTLMKLRLGLLLQDLADRFNISMTHASNIFTTWVKVLAHTLGSLVFNPPKEIVKANLPPTFRLQKKFSNVRHIIDCTEVFLEKPNNLELSAQTWSDYKHHNTGKFLVSINPSGLINFVSQCWGGRTSDKHITTHSGFLDMVERYDSIMADRGFMIREELALIGAELFVPPGRRGASQMSKAEVNLTKAIANQRIYIEQAIRRMKTFRILKYEVPLTLVHHLDDIVKVVAGICNMHPPLPKYK